MANQISLRCRFEESDEEVSLWSDDPLLLVRIPARPLPPQVILAIRRGGVTATFFEGARGTLATWNDGGRPIYLGMPRAV